MKQQPAHINYFFGPGWEALRDTLAETFNNFVEYLQSVLEDFGDIWDTVTDHFSFGGIITFIIRAIAFGIKLAVCAILATVIVAVCSFIHILVVCLVMGAVYVAFSVLWFVDFVYRKIHGIVSHCSNCQNRISLPHYRCACGKVHTMLVPSKYGIFKRRCTCGRLLPTTFLNGRQKLKAICPHCQFDLASGGAHIAVTFPLIGGPSSGKTCFVNMAINSLSKNAQKLGYVFEYEDEGSMTYENNMNGIKGGNFPQKTNDMALVFYRFTWAKHKQTIKNEISLCDIGGETYADKQTLQQQIGYANSQGYLVVIDPLSIKEYREEVEKEHDISSFNASNMSLDEILDMLISTVDNLSGNTSKKKIAKDVAVVFTKLDIPGLEEMIGDTAISTYRETHNVSFLKAQNKLAEDFLRNYGEDNFLNSLHAKFTNIQFFSCVALADDGSGKLYSKNVARPIAWLMNGKGKNIEFTEDNYVSLVD